MEAWFHTHLPQFQQISQYFEFNLISRWYFNGLILYNSGIESGKEATCRRLSMSLNAPVAKVPFTPERISNAIYRAAVSVGGRNRQIAEDLAQQVVALLEENPDPDYTPHIEEIQDIVEKVLIENGHARVAKAYILYRDERTRHRIQQDAQTTRPSENIPWAKIWHVLDWAVDRGLNTVAGLNRRIKAGEFSQVITESEALTASRLNPRLRRFSGARTKSSSSLLPVLLHRGRLLPRSDIGEKLRSAGLNLITLNLDNYFLISPCTRKMNLAIMTLKLLMPWTSS